MRIPFHKSIKLLLLGPILALALFVCGSLWGRPRVWAPAEVPVAFWSWRTQAPSDAELQKALVATNGKTLFLRAGQLDIVNDSVKRVHSVTGTLPSSIELHLVYNGTRKFLSGWENIDAGSLAMTIADVFKSDVTRADANNATVSGLQLDLDIPDRLLPKYAEVLGKLRAMIPAGTKFSVTGLPGWAFANEVDLVLDQVDFWIPQCYGLKIPISADERIPISSASDVERIISRVRQLKKPFYAGLSAYSYAILYGKDGVLLELRGDIDPSAADVAGLDLIERQTLSTDKQAGEIRYVYRANTELVLDGLIVRKDEVLVFYLPSSASLHSSALAVRENAGETLLGICIFRLPTDDDHTTLGIDEIARALSGEETRAISTIKLERLTDDRVKLIVQNTGSARSILGNDALTVEIRVPIGTISAISGMEGFGSYQTFCSEGSNEAAQLCSQRRADTFHFRTNNWNPGSKASAILKANAALPTPLKVVVLTRLDDGRVDRQMIDVVLEDQK